MNPHNEEFVGPTYNRSRDFVRFYNRSGYEAV